jgi:DNA polymerase-3 subunit delta'
MFRIHGHRPTVSLLEYSLKGGHLHHAYLLVGPDHVGKTTLAVQLAQAVNCTVESPPCGKCESCQRINQGYHADVLVLGMNDEQEGQSRKSIGIDPIRELQHSASLRPYEGRKRVYIIQEAERLSQEAANALLKTLEEPPPDVLLIVLTADIDSLLPTVISRCMQLDLRPLPIPEVTQLLQDEYNVAVAEAERFARLSRGCVGWAIQAVQDPEPVAALHQRLERIASICEGDLNHRFSYADDLARRFQRDRAAGREELYLWLRWSRDILLILQGQTDQVVHVTWLETLERLASNVSPREVVAWAHVITDTLDALDQNANPRLALEVLMLEMPLAKLQRIEASNN